MCLFEFVRRVNANIGKNMKTKMKMIEMCVWKCVYVWMNVCITIVVNGYVLWILALSLIYRFYRKRHFLINICFAIFAHSFLFRLCPLLLLLLFLFFFYLFAGNRSGFSIQKNSIVTYTSSTYCHWHQWMCQLMQKSKHKSHTIQTPSLFQHFGTISQCKRSARARTP